MPQETDASKLRQFTSGGFRFTGSAEDNMKLRRAYAQQRKWKEKYVDKTWWAQDSGNAAARQAAEHAEAVRRLATFQRGSMKRQAMTLTCHVTGTSYTHDEVALQACVERRKEMVEETLRRTIPDFPAEEMEFRPPETPLPPAVVDAEQVLGSSRKDTETYNDQALSNYRKSMSSVLGFAAKNPGSVRSATGQSCRTAKQAMDSVNEALSGLQDALREESRRVAVERGREASLWNPLTRQEQRELFDNFDSDKDGHITLSELNQAVKLKNPEFTNKHALRRVYKLTAQSLAHLKVQSQEETDSHGLTWDDREENCGFNRFLNYLRVYLDCYQKFLDAGVQSLVISREQWLRVAPAVLGERPVEDGQSGWTQEELERVWAYVRDGHSHKAAQDDTMRVDYLCAWVALIWGNKALDAARYYTFESLLDPESHYVKASRTATLGYASWRTTGAGSLRSIRTPGQRAGMQRFEST
eukprot:TRINITY_DN65327_c0_g1_i1.p1 TRINITY_DN65327_c0_g1~~TRINITY_DN65327_c0_g1_i1.p1  ORF type:complete len:508 (+),score=171.34 TRINITY_DN65327_c0_g1_i1:113-1525(+)